jgi:hypothetical protein
VRAQLCTAIVQQRDMASAGLAAQPFLASAVARGLCYCPPAAARALCVASHSRGTVPPAAEPLFSSATCMLRATLLAVLLSAVATWCSDAAVLLLASHTSCATSAATSDATSESRVTYSALPAQHCHTLGTVAALLLLGTHTQHSTSSSS